MERAGKLFPTLGALALAGGVVALTAFVPRSAPPAAESAANGVWQLEATNVSVVGGYGDNFAYDGENVRPLDGSAEMTVNPEQGTATLEIELETTAASGPIRFSEDRSWEGEIRIVQELDTQRTDKARIEESVYLHGDTGNEAPVMPKVYNYFATWGPATIWVDGEKVVPMIGSHTMLTTQARDPETGRITNEQGQVYSPGLEDKTGFTDPTETEFHFVAHTSEPDPDNFPPHSGWIHLHFADVEIELVPEGVQYPITQVPAKSGG